MSRESKSSGRERLIAGRYEVLGTLGRGGMSKVFHAYDRQQKCEVAIKQLLPKEETKHPLKSIVALEREAEALARFHHRNVVEIYEFRKDDEMPFVAMEYVEGDNLHSIMKSGALSWEDFQAIAPQCLSALIAAGELGLLHRDIKPGNIMVTMTDSGEFVVKVLDFGLSKFTQSPRKQTHDQQGIFLGTIDFIAPEQLELRHLDARTDIYSLGCVLYYSLAQAGPFSGASAADTTRNHLKHRCRPIGELRPDLPAPVCDWLMRLIALDPDDRPENATAALDEFSRAIGEIDSLGPGAQEKLRA